MKTMCPPGYHHNGFVATHALGHMIYIYIMYINIHVYEHRYSCFGQYDFFIKSALQRKQP